MWGEMVHRAGVGPKPCSVWQLTDQLLADKFQSLTDPEMQAAAQRLASQMASENGIEGGLQHFLSDLPKDNMLCDVSLVMGETRLAKFVAVQYDIKVSVEIAAVLKSMGWKPTPNMTSMDYFKHWIRNVSSAVDRYALRIERHRVTTFGLGRVRTFAQGMIAGIIAFFRHVGLSIIQPCFRSDSWARSFGCTGCLAGAALSPVFVVHEIYRGFVSLLDRILTGFLNGFCGKSYLYTIDLRREDKRVNEKGYVKSRVQELASRGFSKQYQQEVFRACSVVTRAKLLFEAANPFYPDDLWHYKVASASALLDSFSGSDGELSRSLMSEEAVDAFAALLKERVEGALSFSMMLLLLREASRSTGTSSAVPTVQKYRRIVGRKSVFDSLTTRNVYAELFGSVQTDIAAAEVAEEEP